MKKSTLFLVIIIAAGLLYFNRSNISRWLNKPTETNLHYSYFSQREFFDEAFSKAPTLPIKGEYEGIEAVIVNHHLLAPHFIAQGLQTVETDKPVSVVLMSPNHFSVGKESVITSRYSWKTPYGILEPDLTIINYLTKEAFVEVEEEPFLKEHGISGIVAFIKKAIPSAKIVPLIFKERMSDMQADAFAQQLASNLPEGAIIIASLDFSHYHDLQTANLHDEKSLRVLNNFDYDGIKNLDVDSRSAIRVLLKYLDRKGARDFTLLQHSNSAVVARKLDEQETTSYITGYFSR